MTDTEILDWLSMKVVNVRGPLRYGSYDLFWASPKDEDGEPYTASDLRQIVIDHNKGGA